jgi:hypothetical protein
VDQKLGLLGLNQTGTDVGSDPAPFPGHSFVGVPTGDIGLFVTGGSANDASGDVNLGIRYGLLPVGATDVQMVDRSGKVLSLAVQTHAIPGTAYLGVYTEQHTLGSNGAFPAHLRGVRDAVDRCRRCQPHDAQHARHLTAATFRWILP